MINELKRIRRRLEKSEREALWNGATSHNGVYQTEQSSFAAGIRRAILELDELLKKTGEDEP